MLVLPVHGPALILSLSSAIKIVDLSEPTKVIKATKCTGTQVKNPNLNPSQSQPSVTKFCFCNHVEGLIQPGHLSHILALTLVGFLRQDRQIWKNMSFY